MKQLHVPLQNVRCVSDTADWSS